MSDSAPLKLWSPSTDDEPDEPDEPDDGPRYDDENVSATLLRSTFCPREDWSSIGCPDCRQEFLTDGGVARHLASVHSTGRWRSDGGERLTTDNVCKIERRRGE
jgi:hypothetical protein